MGNFFVTKKLTLSGMPGATLDGAGAGTTVVTGPKPVKLIGLTITGGSSPTGRGGGVAVTGGSLTISDSTLTGNLSQGIQGAGGAVWNSGGTVTDQELGPHRELGTGPGRGRGCRLQRPRPNDDDLEIDLEWELGRPRRRGHPERGRARAEEHGVERQLHHRYVRLRGRHLELRLGDDHGFQLRRQRGAVPGRGDREPERPAFDLRFHVRREHRRYAKGARSTVMGRSTTANFTFTANDAPTGGGIANINGAMTMTSSRRERDTASHAGGIWDQTATATVGSSIVAGNAVRPGVPIARCPHVERLQPNRRRRRLLVEPYDGPLVGDPRARGDRPAARSRLALNGGKTETMALGLLSLVVDAIHGRCAGDDGVTAVCPSSWRRGPAGRMPGPKEAPAMWGPTS